MIVPAPWESCSVRGLPQAPSGAFNELFCDVVRTYAGHSCKRLRRLQEGGMALSSSLLAGSAYLHDALHPVVPPCLLQAGAVPVAVPIEDLPAIDCCEDIAAITKLRAYSSRYSESVVELLEIVKEFSGRWGRLKNCERKRLDEALANERNHRFQEDELRACFSDLNFSGKGLRQITPDVTRFVNLTTLVLSNNPQLTSITYLPPACLVLVACGCSICEVCASNSLSFLGLAFNAVKNLDFLSGMPELRVLDLTRNALFSIEATVEAVRQHRLLEDVTFTGCPIALLDDYSERVAVGCPRLQRLDHAPLAARTKPAPGAGGRCGDDIGIEAGTSAVDPATDVPGVVLRVEVVRLEGLAALAHSPVQRDEHTLSSFSEGKGAKAKKKAKAVVMGPAYEWTTSVKLHGSWGGEGEILAVTCDGIRLLPDALAAAQQHLNKKKSQAAPLPVEDARQLNHVVDARLPPTSGLSETLAQPFKLELEVYDEIRFPNGNCVLLTCAIGSFLADASSLLLSTASLPRQITVQESLILSEAALKEKRIHAQEIRERVATAQESLVTFTESSERVPTFSATLGGSSRRSKKSLAATGHNSAAEHYWVEVKRREEEVAELDLLACIEQTRAEELQHAALSLTLEFALGSAPKVVEEEPPARTKAPRRRQGDRERR
ncbi:putative leucine-rich repeat protein (LRRP) [Trypanosoma grayi]|uniref:putative leucine-rich repeat protein (LRRP) n=1 Tax=Trypanosoma grayi TaxID=71804 RepID=UPI0004F4B939|nr:putative leucine-rich repeat protein (LRRP) [Trypanosoma grayi]KEG11275.1 putative leucine-rich repeat protein (LRRP) [Trypanosoma grayi]